MYTRALGADEGLGWSIFEAAERAGAEKKTAEKEAAEKQSGGEWSDFFQNLIGGVATEWVKGKTDSGKTVYVQQSSTPSWLPYVLIGGGVVTVALLLKKK